MKKGLRVVVDILLVALITLSFSGITRIITIQQMERHYAELPYVWEQVDFAEAPWFILYTTEVANGFNESYAWFEYSNYSFIFEVEDGYFLYILITTFVANYFVEYEGRIRKSLEFTFDEPTCTFYTDNVTFWRIVK